MFLSLPTLHETTFKGIDASIYNEYGVISLARSCDHMRHKVLMPRRVQEVKVLIVQLKHLVSHIHGYTLIPLLLTLISHEGVDKRFLPYSLSLLLSPMDCSIVNHFQRME
jgi:hypothetical protein